MSSGFMFTDVETLSVSGLNAVLVQLKDQKHKTETRGVHVSVMTLQARLKK